MPRYYVSTTDCPNDEEGIYVSDRAALGVLLRQALTEIMRDEGTIAGKSEFAAEARDDSGQSVMRARISFSVVG